MRHGLAACAGRRRLCVVRLFIVEINDEFMDGRWGQGGAQIRKGGRYAIVERAIDWAEQREVGFAVDTVMEPVVVVHTANASS